MMKRKGKAPVEKQVKKLVKKKPMSKVKKSQKILQWMKMDSNKLKWVKRTNLENFFNLQWTTPREDMLWDFLQTQEAMQDGRILGQVRGQYEQLGISKEGTVDVTNATFEEAKTTLKRITGPHAFVENEQWSVVRMKEEFHARFVAILQILY